MRFTQQEKFVCPSLCTMTVHKQGHCQKMYYVFSLYIRCMHTQVYKCSCIQAGNIVHLVAVSLSYCASTFVAVFIVCRSLNLESQGGYSKIILVRIEAIDTIQPIVSLTIALAKLKLQAP